MTTKTERIAHLRLIERAARTEAEEAELQALIDAGEAALRASPDWVVGNHGSVWLFSPMNEAAVEHGETHFPDDCPMWGGGYAVEWRYGPDIVEALREEGFVVEGSR